MKNIALRLRYDGSRYHGWQVQKNAITVAQTMEEALAKVCGERVKLTGCGRTDAGVHALRYCANFHSGCTVPVDLSLIHILAYVVDGNYWGFDVQLAMAVCERLGWTLQIQPIEKENVYVELSSGNIDCAWGGIALDQKEIDAGKYTQYGPYVSNNIVVAGRNGSTVWNKLKLGGRTMAMCSTEEAMSALETDPKLAKRLGQIIRLAGGTLECFEYLYSGKCDVVLTDSTALYYYNCH